MRLSLVCFVALLVGGPVASAQVGTAASSDKTIENRIEKRFASDPALKQYNLKVEVDKGIATLSGSVATEAERSQAGADAKIAGITRVDNQILVEPDAGTRGVKGTAGKIGDKTVDKSKEGAQKTKEGGEKVWDKTKAGTKEAGNEITDGWITTRVKTKFVGEDALKNSDIKVSTENHVVTLTGTVATPAGRARAVALAKEVEGVRTVNDRLTVGVKKP